MESLMKISAQCLAEIPKYWQDWEVNRGHFSVLLYKSMAGPHLESYRQFWSLHLIKNIVEWKETQEKATKADQVFSFHRRNKSESSDFLGWSL